MTDPFVGLKPRMRYSHRPPAETRTCVHCKQELPIGEYYINRQGKYSGNCSRYKKYCKKCYCAGKHFKLTEGISYKRALPPELWEDMRRFMAALSNFAEEAEEAGVNPDVKQFMQAYREVKGRI